jgi:hypothetical protein
VSDRKQLTEEYPELDRRVANMMWTVSGRYDEKLSDAEKNWYSRDSALYYGITAGGRRRFLDWDMVKRFTVSRSRNGFETTVLMQLLRIVTDGIVEKQLIRERPGIETIRRSAFQAATEQFMKLHTGDLMEKTVLIDSLRKAGKNPAADTRTAGLLHRLDELKGETDTETVLRGIEAVYLDYFPLLESDGEGSSEGTGTGSSGKNQGSDFNDFMYEELYSEEELAEAEASLEETARSLLEGTFEEPGVLDTCSPSRVIRIREEDLEEIYATIVRQFGQSYLKPGEIIALQNRTCRGIHENCRILMTDGVLRSPCDNDFRTAYVRRQIEKNLLTWHAGENIYRRIISKLTESIRRTLLQEEAPDRILSDNGTIVPPLLWHIGRSSNNRVFTRSIDNAKGRYVVDILIDSSGSQSKNQHKVAVQGYILTEALTRAGIPVRVNSYSSFIDYTVLTRYRDYDAPVSQNINLFEYFGTGNNRDGLAIRIAADGLAKRPEENKILIVLSDGRPNDIQIGAGRRRDLNQAYQGMNAVRDTALEVRRARQAGLMVLGIFTGSRRDLPAEKLIYGNDFFFIEDIRRFAETAIQYIKRIITE